MTRDFPPLLGLATILISAMLITWLAHLQAQTTSTTNCTTLMGHLTAHTFTDTVGMPHTRPVLNDEAVLIPYAANGIICFDGPRATDRRCIGMSSLRRLTYSDLQPK